MREQLKKIHAQALDELKKVVSPEELDSWRVCYLGKKSGLTQLLRSLASLPVEERREIGAKANEVKNALESELAEKKERLQEALLAYSLSRRD